MKSILIAKTTFEKLMENEDFRTYLNNEYQKIVIQELLLELMDKNPW